MMQALIQKKTTLRIWMTSDVSCQDPQNQRMNPSQLKFQMRKRRILPTVGLVGDVP
jgi:hypothetical protein